MARKNLFQGGVYTEVLAHLDKATRKAFPDSVKRVDAIKSLITMLESGDALDLSKLVSLYKTFQRASNPAQIASTLASIYEQESSPNQPEPSLANPTDGY